MRILMPTIKNIYLDGHMINSEHDFHKVISSALDFGPYYGNNLDALWDMLSSGAAGGIILHWKNAEISQQKMGAVFETIVCLFKEAQDRDVVLGVDEKFEFILE